MKKFWRRLATLTLYPLVFALVCAVVIPIAVTAALFALLVRWVLAAVITLTLFVAIGAKLWFASDGEVSKAVAKEIRDFNAAFKR